MVRFSLIVALVVSSLTASFTYAQSREQKVRSDRDRVVAEGFWIYNDMLKAFSEARKQDKPILVVMRCLPCTECVKLDDELIDQDPEVKQLLQDFVCVRVISTNGLDLSLFQFDTDQSFAVFMLNADGTIYGRYGTRSHRTEWEGDVSVKGLAKALEGAVELHENYDTTKASLQAKRGRPLEFLSPEQYPAHRGKFKNKINYQGDVVKSCIHCHQIGDARRDFYWGQGKKLPEELLFPYPHPKILGVTTNPDTKSTVTKVESRSWADLAGIRRGDEIVSMDGQPILSVADMQWVLHNTKSEGAKISVTVNRSGREIPLNLDLPKDWRRTGDLDWRVSSWQLRRKFFGGMKLDPLPAEDKKRAGLRPNESAMLVKHVGRYAPHNFAQRSGVKIGDIITSFDEVEDFETETDLFTHAADHFDEGETIPLGVIRGGKPQTIRLKLP